MRARSSALLGLLLVVTLTNWVTASGEDLYWEDGDQESEFLEVKDDSHLDRFKRALEWFNFNPFASTTTTTPSPENIEINTEDPEVPDNDDEGHLDGSGSYQIPKSNSESGEKTLRVTFVVMEPYQDEYSNRDSGLFQTFSHNLAGAVNKLFEGLDGTPKSSLIRIQSRPADSFSCKVTLDIVTTADNTEQIADLLRVHIRNTRHLGGYALDADYTANVVKPGSSLELCSSEQLQCNDGTCVSSELRCDGRPDCSDGEDENDCPSSDEECSADQLRCNDGTCVSGDLRCNGNYDCSEGEDEYNCPGSDDQDQFQTEDDGETCEKTYRCAGSEISLCAQDTCNGIADCPGADDESAELCSGSDSNNEQTTRKLLADDDEETTPDYPACRPEEFRCDETRCILRTQVCDQENDCTDGTDESTCPGKQCGRDDFRCNDNMCIAGHKRCDRIFDCRDNEDEIGCDECPPDAFICPLGSQVTCATRCDDERECLNGEDEEGCDDECPHECDGRCLEESQICNNYPDCSDGSDETNCDRCDGPGDFRCSNMQCIKLTERCNGVVECDDESDERHCNDTVIAKPLDKCLDDEFVCGNGVCLNPNFVCDQSVDCDDGSDEANCGHIYGYDTTPSVFTTTNRAFNPYGSRTERPGPDDRATRQPNAPVSTESPNGYPNYNPEPNTEVPYGSNGQESDNRDRYDPYNPSSNQGRQPDNGDRDRYDPYGPNQGRQPNQYDQSTNRNDVYNQRGQTDNRDDRDRYDPYGNNQGRQPDNRDDRDRYDPYGNNQGRQPDNRDDQSTNRYDPYNPSPNQGGQTDNRDDRDRYDPYGSNQGRQPDNRDDQSTNRYDPYNPSPNQGGQTDNRDDRDRYDPYGNNQGRQPDNRDDRDRYDPYGQPDNRGDESTNRYDPYNPSPNQGGQTDNQDGRGQYNPYGNNQGGQPENRGDESTNRYDPYNPSSNQGGQTDNRDDRDQYDPYGNNQGGQPDNRGDESTNRFDPYNPSSNQGGQTDNRDDSNGRYDPYGSSSNQGGQGSGIDESTNRYDPYNPSSNQGGQTDNRDDRDQYDPYGNNQGGQPDNRGDESTNRYDPYNPSSNQGGQTDNRDGRGQYNPYGNNQGGQPDNRGDESTNRYDPYNPSSNQGGQTDNRDDSNGRYDPYGSSSNQEGQESGNDNGYPTRSPPTSPPRYPGPVSLNLKTYPNEQSVRFAQFGGDVVFTCRDEGPERAPVRWVREGGRPLKSGSTDRKGRLEMFQVTPADGGVYICQALGFLGKPGSEVRVTLNVEKEIRAPTRPPYAGCRPHEATCGNGECVPKSVVCDGKPDCSDNTDEDMCSYNGQCEPNQFQCLNRKCVLKTWLCDSDDDCGDGSDERGCPQADPGSLCLPSEFACHNNSQCIRRSFHCDGQMNDCLDGSDEIGCSKVYISRPPKPAFVKLNGGDTLELVCEAVGVPVPIVSWRLNWGHIPDKCVTTNLNGIGRLTCRNMRQEDSGAYSCEAINNKGSTFATPDSMVTVGQNSPCPEGYFNSEAQSAQDCIRCFCFGRATQCHSADLFTYNMPTALGDGGTRLVGVALSDDGKVRTDQSIINHYYFQAMRNGAAVTKLASRDPNWLGNYHPYLTLPESYNGNQLTSYGGHIRYTVRAHAYPVNDDVPSIIVEGTYATLYHIPGNESPAQMTLINARFVPEYWRKADAYGGLIPATREDIMMALDDVKMILLRADNNNAGVNITDFVMESAQSINSNLGAASLVEECRCPEGYEGLSCQKCKAGYLRENSGPWLGQCVRKACPPGTYGDPSSGDSCKPCPCPLTNKENQFATTCSLQPDGSVACDCFPGYEGKNCEKCSPGFEGNPLMYGNKCRMPTSPKCNEMGTRNEPQLDECACKDNVQGRYCDECRNGSFYLSNDFRQGCALCFCSGESQTCMSSNLRRKTTAITFNVPSIVDELRVYNTLPQGSGNFRYTAPVETELRPTLTRNGEFGLSGIDRSRPTVYYWSMPSSFAGDKVTAYGGFLRYTLDNVPSYIDARLKNGAADIQLISDNHLTFQYFGEFRPAYEGTMNVSVQLLEKGWQRSDGKEVPREHFLLALADVKAILIKATYSTDAIATPIFASIDTATDDGEGSAALHVEQCVCPHGYVGTSCEDCAPGFTRGEGGLYLAHCEECQCNHHSTNCHPENGECYNCQDNTEGAHCELCKEGYERDGYDGCKPIEGDSETSSSRPCRCDPRGEEEACFDGYCNCKRNVDGENCDRCREGTFGLSEENPEGCIECYCSGATTECQEANHYYRTALPAPIFGDNYGGYTITDLNAKTVINDHFVPVPDKSELMYIFSFPPEASYDLYWSLPIFPGNRIMSYGGKLSLRQEFKSNDDEVQMSEPGNDVILAGDNILISWYNRNPLRSGESKSLQIPLQEQQWRVMNSGAPVSRAIFMRVLKSLKRVLVKATLASNIVSTSISDVSMDIATDIYQPNTPVARNIEMCSCPPGHMGTSCETCAAGYYKDHQDYCNPCPCNGHDCHLNSNGEVECSCRPPFTGRDCSAKADSQTEGTTNRPPIGPSTITVKINSDKIAIREIGSNINLTCEARSTYTRSLRKDWSKVDGPLPQGRYETNPYTGVLTITNLQITDSGVYICQSTDGISTGHEYVTLRIPDNKLKIPTVDIRPQAINEYYVGDRVELVCETTGSPRPTLSWQRSSGRVLPPYSQTIDNVLLIENVQEQDGGEYRCIASNILGRIDGTAVLNIRPKPSVPKVDSLVVSPITPTVNEGQAIRVVCTASSNVPTGSLAWVRLDSEPLTENIRTDNGVLYIEEARPENAGVYICRTDSAAVPSQQVLVTVVSTAPPPSPDDIPEVTVPITRLKIPSGSSNKVDCIPKGEPLPVVRWTKHNGELGPGVSQRGNSLLISDAEESYSGYYQCQGLDPYDNRVLSDVYLYVEIERRERPGVEVWPPGESPVALGDTTFEFRCVVNGIPEPDVTWSRGSGRALSSHAQIIPNNILRFEKIEVNDEGEYICTGTNIVGSASSSAVLKVRSPPEIVITPGNELIVEYREPVSVDCRADGYPEPSISIRGPNNNVIANGSRIASLRIMSASASDDGEYTCIASNPAGFNEDRFLIRVEERGDGADFGGSGDDRIDPNSGNQEQSSWGNSENDPYYPSRPNPNPSQPLERIVHVGTDMSIHCDVADSYAAQWDRADGSPMQSNIEQDGKYLIFRNVSKENGGVYVCRTYNYNNNEMTQVLYTNIKVVYAPVITLRPKSQVVSPGSSPIVECVVHGDDIIQIEWRPVEKPFSNRVIVRNATLIFQQIEIEDAGKYQCIATSRHSTANATAEVLVVGAPTKALVRIDQPRRAFRAGENVKVLCRSISDDVTAEWIKRDENGNLQFVEFSTYGDGSMLKINSVSENDAGVYQCTGRTRRGQNFTDMLTLEVEPGTALSNSRDYSSVQEFSAPLRTAVSLPCTHDMEGEVSVNWKREYTPLSSDITTNQPVLHIDNVGEEDAGIYVCRISNSRHVLETRAILHVTGIVPRFEGDGWLSLPTLKDAYRKFDIEISFKPTEPTGLILYNSEGRPEDRNDYIALLLNDGYPEFILNYGSGPVHVKGNKQLSMNEWHNIRLNKLGSKVMMDVDNDGPFVENMDERVTWLLELHDPLYIGGVPNARQLPRELEYSQSFTGCVSMLILGHEEKNIITEQLSSLNVKTCNTCDGNLCQNQGICQESRTERGYTCLCPSDFSGVNCERRGEGCRPGICGPGRCTNTDNGYKCACPVTHTGTNCENRQQIEYPAFTGSAYVALKPPNTARILKMSMKIKAMEPVTDGIIMYCAETPRGIGGFTSLAVKNKRLEFQYDQGNGYPVVLVSNTTLPADEWTDVQVTRSGSTVALVVNLMHTYEKRLRSSKELKLETPMFVGGVDDSIVINSNLGINAGFMGCIKDLKTHGGSVDIVNDPVESVNLQECSRPRGDIPEEPYKADYNPCHCRNGGSCAADGACICPQGFTGYYCENRTASSLRHPPRAVDPCAGRPCKNRGICKPDYSSNSLLNHTCDCPLGFSGASCQMRFELGTSVGFNGNGFVELPRGLVRYEDTERDPALIMLRTITQKDGILVFQHEIGATVDDGDFLMIRIENGYVVLEWNLGSGITLIKVDGGNNVGFVADGEMHTIVVRVLSDGRMELSVDGTTQTGFSNGISSRLGVDSNIYIGGVPDNLNPYGHPGLTGCIDQVEFMHTNRGVILGETAVNARNTQPCKYGF